MSGWIQYSSSVSVDQAGNKANWITKNSKLINHRRNMFHHPTQVKSKTFCRWVAFWKNLIKVVKRKNRYEQLWTAEFPEFTFAPTKNRKSAKKSSSMHFSFHFNPLSCVFRVLVNIAAVYATMLCAIKTKLPFCAFFHTSEFFTLYTSDMQLKD